MAPLIVRTIAVPCSSARGADSDVPGMMARIGPARRKNAIRNFLPQVWPENE